MLRAGRAPSPPRRRHEPRPQQQRRLRTWRWGRPTSGGRASGGPNADWGRGRGTHPPTRRRRHPDAASSTDLATASLARGQRRLPCLPPPSPPRPPPRPPSSPGAPPPARQPPPELASLNIIDRPVCQPKRDREHERRGAPMAGPLSWSSVWISTEQARREQVPDPSVLRNGDPFRTGVFSRGAHARNGICTDGGDGNAFEPRFCALGRRARATVPCATCDPRLAVVPAMRAPIVEAPPPTPDATAASASAACPSEGTTDRCSRCEAAGGKRVEDDAVQRKHP